MPSRYYKRPCFYFLPFSLATTTFAEILVVLFILCVGHYLKQGTLKYDSLYSIYLGTWCLVYIAFSFSPVVTFQAMPKCLLFRIARDGSRYASRSSPPLHWHFFSFCSALLQVHDVLKKVSFKDSKYQIILHSKNIAMIYSGLKCLRWLHIWPQIISFSSRTTQALKLLLALTWCTRQK